MSRFVTVSCACGAVGEAEIGAHVECECGRSFDAEAPPAEHVAEIRQLERRHRVLLAGSLVAVLLVCAAPLVVLDRSAALLVPVAAIALWLSTVRPPLQRRHRRALATLPGWSIGR